MKIILNLMVKNESAIIERCIRSVMPYMDAFCILDTGCTDDTIDKIKTLVPKNKLSVFFREFDDFSSSRNYLLERTLANHKYEDGDAFQEDIYVFFIDADNVFDPRGDFREQIKSGVVSGTNYDCYGNELFKQVRLLKLSLFEDGEASYKLPTHEVLDCPPEEYTHSEKILVKDYADSYSRKNNIKTKRDIELLSNYIDGDTQDSEYYHWLPRARFYLANSLMDNGEYRRAADEYFERFEMKDTWEQERYCSAIYLAKCWIECTKNNEFISTWGEDIHFEDIVYILGKAYQMCPDRLEAPYYLAWLHLNGPIVKADFLPRIALLWINEAFDFRYSVKDTSHHLFPEKYIYNYALDKLRGLINHYCGRSDLAIQMLKGLAQRDADYYGMSPQDVERINSHIKDIEEYVKNTNVE